MTKDGRKSRDHCHSSHCFCSLKNLLGAIGSLAAEPISGWMERGVPRSGGCGPQVFFVFHVLGVIFPMTKLAKKKFSIGERKLGEFFIWGNL